MRSRDWTEERGVGAEHIHRHVIKGWTTNVTSRDKYKDESSVTGVTSEEAESQQDWEQTSERGAHIYKHVIKGWTMDPHANEGFQRNSERAELKETNKTRWKATNVEDEDSDVAIYRREMVFVCTLFPYLCHCKSNKDF